MDDNSNFLDKFKKVKVIKRCPSCGSLSLKYSEGKLICENCAYSQNIGKL